MNKKLLKITTLAASILFASQTIAAEGGTSFYATLGAGYTFSQKSGSGVNDTTNPPSLNIGTKPSNAPVYYAAIGGNVSHFRGEVEFFGVTKKYTSTWRQSPGNGLIYKAALSDQALFANAYFDMPKYGNMFTPYVGVGLGGARHKGTVYADPGTGNMFNEKQKVTKNSFAWNVRVGTKIDLVPDVIYTDINARYVDLGRVTVTSTEAAGGVPSGATLYSGRRSFGAVAIGLGFIF